MVWPALEGLIVSKWKGNRDNHRAAFLKGPAGSINHKNWITARKYGDIKPHVHWSKQVFTAQTPISAIYIQLVHWSNKLSLFKLPCSSSFIHVHPFSRLNWWNSTFLIKFPFFLFFFSASSLVPLELLHLGLWVGAHRILAIDRHGHTFSRSIKTLLLKKYGLYIFIYIYELQLKSTNIFLLTFIGAFGALNHILLV